MFQIVLFNRPKSLNLSHKIDSAGSFFFTSNLLLLLKVVSAESANARWQNFHPFSSVFAYFFQNVQNEEILGSNWGQSNFMTEVGKKGGNVSYYFKSAPKGQKKATSRWVSSTMKVEVSNKYSEVYCYCCHLCSQKKPTIFLVKIKENEVLNRHHRKQKHEYEAKTFLKWGMVKKSWEFLSLFLPPSHMRSGRACAPNWHSLQSKVDLSSSLHLTKDFFLS